MGRVWFISVKIISYHTPAEHGARHRLHLPPLPREQRESIPRAVRDRSASPIRRAPQSALQSPTPSLTPVPTPSIIPTSSLIRPREPFVDQLVRRPARINALEHGQKLDQTLAALRSLSATLSGTQSQVPTHSVFPLSPPHSSFFIRMVGFQRSATTRFQRSACFLLPELTS
ncbi:hypothetical protein NEOLEDRAFT_171067 [Neolentinus lepideus HHB14362 ss-1]|uniref:Uncharacterized protein n=1 Tax=Neolentinus lepideus HHB14362 ss-1 TaxID=1314782 RepID=A0A165MJE7_9AGAM|nr:hypothetical protein NEOLEDRAFT_171067 [Neolentinus lepideus HHB14362 ss-1]